MNDACKLVFAGVAATRRLKAPVGVHRLLAPGTLTAQVSPRQPTRAAVPLFSFDLVEAASAAPVVPEMTLRLGRTLNQSGMEVR